MTSDDERDFMCKQFEDADREAARENCTGGIAATPGESSGYGVIATIGGTKRGIRMNELIEYKFYFDNMEWAERHVLEIATVQQLEKFRSIVEAYDQYFAPVNYPGALDHFREAYSRRLAELKTIPLDTSKPQA